MNIRGFFRGEGKGSRGNICPPRPEFDLPPLSMAQHTLTLKPAAVKQCASPENAYARKLALKMRLKQASIVQALLALFKHYKNHCTHIK